MHDNFEDCYDKCNAETFIQDVASCHTGNVVKEWLDMCALDCFDWPANSLNLDLIKQFWSIMKKELQEVASNSVPVKRCTAKIVE